MSNSDGIRVSGQIRVVSELKGANIAGVGIFKEDDFVQFVGDQRVKQDLSVCVLVFLVKLGTFPPWLVVDVCRFGNR